MARIVALYRRPVDAQVFDRYYYETHVPLAKRIPGLRRYEVSAGPVLTPVGPSPYHLVATLEFGSIEALQVALTSPAGQATAADLANFASAGAELLVFATSEV
jgi:uncharacterized protein (TIGR02118 family)